MSNSDEFMSDISGGDFEMDSDFDFDSDPDFSDSDFNEEDYSLGDSAGISLLNSMEIKRQISYSIMHEDELRSTAEDRVSEVTDILALPARCFGAILLSQFEWGKERLISSYFEDSERVLMNSGIFSLELEDVVTDPDQEFECLICMENTKASETFALGCKHRYCNDCWRSYLAIIVRENPNAVKTRCPYPKCKNIVHDQAWKKLVSEEEYEKYMKSSFRSLISDNPHVKFCPAPDCNFIIQSDRKNRKQAITCNCGFSFCYRCSDYDIGDHTPANCDQVDMWQRKAVDESENVAWIIANCKKCPQCRKPIEKNGGCMHMTCRANSGGCGYEFCWLCRGDWKEHGSHTGGYYSCNKYDSSSAKEEDQAAEDVKTELEKYMFYYHRYESHHNAMKIADKQRKGAQTKGEDIVAKFTVRSQDIHFLMDATEQLLLNRRALANSYIVGYYLLTQAGTEKNLFEYLQEDLEKHTNYLSDLYERPLSEIPDYKDFINWKEEVTNYTRVTCQFLERFIEGAMNGLTN